MKDDILNRIISIMGYYSINQRTLSQKIGISPQTVNNQLNAKSALSLDLINAIIEAFPDISAEWLLRGEGEMLRSSSSASNVQTNVKVGGNNSGVIGSGQINGGKEEYIKKLEETVEKQNERIDKLIAIIEKK